MTTDQYIVLVTEVDEHACGTEVKVVVAAGPYTYAQAEEAQLAYYKDHNTVDIIQLDT